MSMTQTARPQFVAAYTSDKSQSAHPDVDRLSETQIASIVNEMNMKATRYDYAYRSDRCGDWIIERTKA